VGYEGYLDTGRCGGYAEAELRCLCGFRDWLSGLQFNLGSLQLRKTNLPKLIQKEVNKTAGGK
jgi:hypothetical protein